MQWLVVIVTMDQGEQTCLLQEVRLRSSTNTPDEEINEQRDGFAGALRRDRIQLCYA